MITEYLLRIIFGFFLKTKVLSIGTKYHPTNEIEREYVDMINYTKTMLLELDHAHITTKKIFYNLINEIGEDNIPKNRRFIELKPPDNRVDEYALLSNIIIGSDRYLYVEAFDHDEIIDGFVDIIKKEKGVIIEKSACEIVSLLPSKNDAIRTALELIVFGMNKDVDVRAAVGMTGAAATERAINLNKEINDMSGVGFTKLGGEFAVAFSSKPEKLRGKPSSYDNYLFMDVIDSTKFIEKNGREKLVKVMNDIKDFIETECRGKVEGYKEGGDDLIANLPAKDVALRAGIDSAWHALDNGAKLRIGVGKSRRESAERAQIADNIKIWSSSPAMVFDVADGIYAYYIPSEFTTSTIDFILHEKFKALSIFIFVFIASFLDWRFGIVAMVLSLLYVLTS